MISKEKLTTLQGDFPSLSLLVLIGSRANDTARADSDWDFVFDFSEPDYFTRLQYTEQLRAELAKLTDCTSNADIDLIDFQHTNLAMRAAIANEGKPLIITDHRQWHSFLTVTWQQLEYWYWEREHAA